MSSRNRYEIFQCLVTGPVMSIRIFSIAYWLSIFRQLQQNLRGNNCYMDQFMLESNSHFLSRTTRCRVVPCTQFSLVWVRGYVNCFPGRGQQYFNERERTLLQQLQLFTGSHSGVIASAPDSSSFGYYNLLYFSRYHFFHLASSFFPESRVVREIQWRN